MLRDYAQYRKPLNLFHAVYWLLAAGYLKRICDAVVRFVNEHLARASQRGASDTNEPYAAPAATGSGAIAAIAPSGYTLMNFPLRPLSSNFTTPSISANKVSSLPRPTFLPGFHLVPRWRARILPPSTRSPPNFFKPNRCEFESRPLREE